MKQRIPVSVFIVSAFLVVYVLVISAGASSLIGRIMFIASPFLVIWMVISVLRSKTFTGKDLDEGEEWGYSDKEKEKLGMF
jgi:hypothetical protein